MFRRYSVNPLCQSGLGAQSICSLLPLVLLCQKPPADLFILPSVLLRVHSLKQLHIEVYTYMHAYGCMSIRADPIAAILPVSLSRLTSVIHKSRERGREKHTFTEKNRLGSDPRKKSLPQMLRHTYTERQRKKEGEPDVSGSQSADSAHLQPATCMRNRHISTSVRTLRVRCRDRPVSRTPCRGHGQKKKKIRRRRKDKTTMGRRREYLEFFHFFLLTRDHTGKLRHAGPQLRFCLSHSAALFLSGFWQTRKQMALGKLLTTSNRLV